MTTCASIDIELDSLQIQLNDIRSLINRWVSSTNNSENPNALKSYADFLLKLMLDAAQQFNIAKSLQQRAEKSGCLAEASKAVKLANEASSLQQQAMQGEQAAKNKASRIERETAQATTSQNNPGTGTPGTAGTGPGATPNSDQIKEIDIQSKKVPEEVTVTGTRRAEDGLDEVSVTGKRNPDALEEVQVTGQRNPDELEEVSLNSKRAEDPSAGPENTAAGVAKARPQAVLKDTTNFEAKKDWRVRMSLSPGANYLYKAQNPGILAPLMATDGVLFPYTPSIQVAYSANYDGTSLTHTNYKFYQYANSNVDNVQITCDFTAQDTFEANYLLAVIHFFRSITKMFYGQDENPKPGTPPPLCYLFGLGEYQFNAHPLAVTNFSYSLPNNVDYIRANPFDKGRNEAASTAGRNGLPLQAPTKPDLLSAIKGAVSQSRLVQGISKLGSVIGVDLIPGGNLASPNFQNNTGFNSVVPPGTNEPTYVPTSIQISISCIPIVSRYDISNEFSLKEYATGELLRGVKRSGGGIW